MLMPKIRTVTTLKYKREHMAQPVMEAKASMPVSLAVNSET
jgi:hypothetical protein